MNENAGYLDVETKRWATNHGMARQLQVSEYNLVSPFDDRHAWRAEHLREIDRPEWRCGTQFRDELEGRWLPSGVLEKFFRAGKV